MAETDRAHDLVVWGATGVVGRLVAEYLTEAYAPGELGLAIGGRNEDRLASLEAELTARADEWDELPVLLGDAGDPERLREIAHSTAVVCTTVGPYTEHGTPLVAACIDAGTEYCDLTGEINWIREIIDRYHDAALEAETRIVHSCGFDCVPADVGTLLVQSAAREAFDAPCETVRIYVEEASGSVSGGTVASFDAMFEAVSEDPIARRTLENPYSLAPPGERDGVDPGRQHRPTEDALGSGWTAPSPMAPVNERVVRRTNALLGYPYGREFRCSEVVPTGPGLTGAVGASLVTGGIELLTAAMSVDAVRAGVRRLAPDQGEGPTRAQIENGRFRVRVRGRGTAPAGAFTVEAVIGADLDPGYGATARMLGEAGVCLVRDETATDVEGGVLTPASGIGEPLADRLRNAGLAVDVSEPSLDTDG